MTEINHLQFPAFLQKAAAPSKGVYLLHGDQTLIEQCLAPLIDFLLQGGSRELNCESLDGLAENIADALAQLNTLSLMSGPKILVFKNAALFDNRGDQQRQEDQIREAMDAERVENAAKVMLGLCRRLGLDLADLAPGRPLPAELSSLQEAVGEDGLLRLAGLCREKGWSAEPAADPGDALSRAIEKGFPNRHYLVITSTTRVPKNRKLYKTILSHGWIIDCSVPLGEKKADKTAQEEVLRRTLERLLTQSGKKLAPALFARLIDLTGFDLPVFIQNVDKLIAYVGDRREITVDDITTVLRRTKSDPVFELTNAVAERRLGRALACLQGLLKGDEWHPLPLVAALANQLRKLLLARDFTASKFGRSWSAGMAYAHFQSQVLPALAEFDAWVAGCIPTPQAGADDSGKSKNAAVKIDLALAANPHNAYPIYQTLLKSDNYSTRELIQALIATQQADLRLKSTGQDPAVVLTHLLLSICGPTAEPAAGRASQSVR